VDHLADVGALEVETIASSSPSGASPAGSSVAAAAPPARGSAARSARARARGGDRGRQQDRQHPSALHGTLLGSRSVPAALVVLLELIELLLHLAGSGVGTPGFAALPGAPPPAAARPARRPPAQARGGRGPCTPAAGDPVWAAAGCGGSLPGIGGRDAVG